MKNYKLFLGGLGAEVIIHPVTEEQKSTLIEWGVNNENPDSNIDLDGITELLELDSWDYAEDTYTGSYSSTDGYHIYVQDEKDEIVWKSDENFKMIVGNDDGDNTLIADENILVIEHYVKGSFKEYELNIEGEFDPMKISYKRASIHDCIEVITDLKYDEQTLDLYEHGDFWSKGCFFYLF